MTHEQALEAAHCAYYHGAGPSWETGVDAAVCAYLKARAEKPTDWEERRVWRRGTAITVGELLDEFKVDA